MALNALVRRYDYLPERTHAVRRSTRTDDYIAEATEGAVAHPGLALTQLGHVWHYRVQYGDGFYWRGRGEFCGLADGFVVYIGDCELPEPIEVLSAAPDMLRIRVGNKGAGEYIPHDGDPVAFDGPSALVMIEPAEAAPAWSGNEGHNRMVQIYASRAVVQDLYGGDEVELPAVLQAFLAGELRRSVARCLPLTPALLRCLDDLQSCEHEGRTRRHYIQSKTMEIFCHVFEALQHEDGFGTAEASLITSRGVLKAQAILLEHFVNPPSLDDLAHAVGLSRTSLTAGFRRILGQSVFDYVQDLRMQHALELLNERGSSITQVAFAVGYNHVSSFSVAVQKRFGTTPRDLRRKGMGARAG